LPLVQTENQLPVPDNKIVKGLLKFRKWLNSLTHWWQTYYPEMSPRTPTSSPPRRLGKIWTHFRPVIVPSSHGRIRHFSKCHLKQRSWFVVIMCFFNIFDDLTFLINLPSSGLSLPFSFKVELEFEPTSEKRGSDCELSTFTV